MHLQYGFRSLALILLLFMLIWKHGEGHSAHKHSSSLRIPPEVNYQYKGDRELLYAFFTSNDLKVGRTMTLFMGGSLFASGPPDFLPKEMADSIPFSLSKLPYILQLFGFEEGSPQAQAMKDTLTSCDGNAADAEMRKFCPTSLEAMVDFVHELLGTDVATLLKMVGPKPTKTLQNYTILEEPLKRVAPKSVGCHMVPYPYAVYYCHALHGENNVYEVSLKGEYDKAPIKAIAVCHMDTSHHDPNHAVFQFLGIKAGESDVCHVFPAEDILWVPSSLDDQPKSGSEVEQKISSSKIMSVIGELLD